MNLTITDLGNPKDAVKLAMLAAKTAEAFAKEFGEGRTGGYLHLCAADGRPLLHIACGMHDPQKWVAYERNALEKPRRMLGHPGHLTSWESRNPAQRQWGGAIRLPNDYGLSFSGFHEPDDSLWVTVLARATSTINDAYALLLLERYAASDRERYEEMLNFVLLRM